MGQLSTAESIWDGVNYYANLLICKFSSILFSFSINVSMCIFLILYFISLLENYAKQVYLESYSGLFQC